MRTAIFRAAAQIAADLNWPAIPFTAFLYSKLWLILPCSGRHMSLVRIPPERSEEQEVKAIRFWRGIAYAPFTRLIKWVSESIGISKYV